MKPFTRFPGRALTRLFALSGALTAFGVALPASAEPTFPGVIQKQFGGQCAPQCTLCHLTEAGGLGSYQPSELSDGYVSKDLGDNRGEGTFFANFVAVNHGSLPTNDTQLEQKLKVYSTANCNATSTKPCDSDGDTVADTVELGMDRDPNIPNDKPGDLCVGPKYGCGANIGTLPHESSATRTAASLVALIGVGLVLLRRARR
jgi:hypothetical protein